MATAHAPTRHTLTYQAEAHTAASTAGYQRRIAELEHALEQTGTALVERDETIARLNAALRFEYDTRRNAELGPGPKHTLIALRREIDSTPADADGWHTIYIGGSLDEHGKPIADGLVGKVGQSRGAITDHLKAIAATGAIELKTIPIRTAKGEYTRRTLVRRTPLLDRPSELKLPEPRNHGGPRCKTCGNDTQLAGRIYRCKQGHEHIEPVKATRGQDDTSGLLNQQGGGVSTRGQDDTRLFAWVADIAGEGERHIEMQLSGSDKYKWRRGAVTPKLAAAHLAGELTIGATLRRHDGRTWVLSWDRDDEAGADLLACAGVKLAASGACVTYAPSPARNEDGTQRGARLDIFFDEPVNATDARATALAHAPELADVCEYWPNVAGGNGQATRLPFARYRRGSVDEWCTVEFMDGERLSGLDAARRVFTDDKTPASWVTETAEADIPLDTPKREPAHAPPSLVFPSEPVPLTVARATPAALSDSVWLAKYGAKRSTLWFANTEDEAATWFNARHCVTDMVDVNRDGYTLATWRGERTASVKITDTNGFIDYGAKATVKAGDALELYCLVHGVSRADVLADATRAMLSEARGELEDAAQAGRGLPAWVHAITTPAGWKRYEQLAAARGTLNTTPTRYAGEYLGRRVRTGTYRNVAERQEVAPNGN